MKALSSTYLIAAFACVSAMAIGCDSKPTRLPLQGTVKVDGEPLVFGSIVFVPDGAGPKAAATIRNGKYEVEAKRGPLSGGMTVEIRSPKMPSGLSPEEGTEKLIHDTVNAPESLPAKYNRASELRAEVKADGPNEFNFDLTTK